MLTNANINKFEVDEMIKSRDKVYFTSYFEFLRSHKGFRPGCIHLVLGTPSGGKSTLVRSLILDLLVTESRSPKVLLWLSEETTFDFLSEFHRSKPAGDLNNLIMFSEIDYLDERDKTSEGQVLLKLLNTVQEERPDVLIIDNITTSMFYCDKKVSEQSRMASTYKKIATKLKIPIVLIAHTGAQVTENFTRVIDQNDIRGSKSIVNLAEFVYILQTFTNESFRLNTIRITKHRGQNIGARLFNLRYAAPSRVFGADNELNFSEFKEAFKSRNKL